MCRHCGKGRVTRPNGLCWRCYYTPGVREQYPPASKFARRGWLPTGAGPLPPEPTAARPGSPEKVAVMEWRAAMGFQLWHPGDHQGEAT